MSVSANEEPGGPPRDNGDWVHALEGGGHASEAAQGDLRRVLVAGLRRILASRGVSDDLCEDVAQEALVKIRERIGTFRGESRFVTWALAIATRLAFDELRHKRWQDVSFDAASTDAQAVPPRDTGPGGSPERALLRARVVAELRDIVENKLTEKQRAVLVAELDGMPHAEIAKAIGMKRNAVYKLSHDARRRVKFHLDAAGLSEEEVLWVFE